MKIKLMIFAVFFMILSLSGFSQNAINPEFGLAPGTYIIENGKETVKIPFIIKDMEIEIKAEMNGKKINFLIDNGVMWDELCFFGSSLVDSLGMIYDGDAYITGAGEGEGLQSYTASDVTISFDGITFYGQGAYITSKESGFAEWWPGIAGQVCGSLFKHFVVEFNFDENIMTLHKPENFVYKGKGNSLKMTRDSVGSYSIPIVLKQEGEKKVNYNLFIDIGTEAPIYIAINENDGIFKPENSKKILLGYAASGEINGYEGAFESIKLAGYKLNDVIAKFTETDFDNTTCTLGLPLLMHFNVIFDYFNEVIYLEPNKSFDNSFIINIK